jgi:hypothetical protein
MAFGDFTVDRNSPKWVLGADGYLKEYIADEPAIEFNADGSYKGVLVEPEIVNEAKASEDLDNATYWNIFQTTIASDTETDPKGGTNSFLLSETVDNNSHGINIESAYRPTVSAAGETWTQSIFVKKGNGANAPDIVQLTNIATYFGTQYANFDISVGGGTSGTVTASSGGTAGIRYYGNGWYRISWTATSTGAGVSFLSLLFTNNNPTAGRQPSYAGQTDANVFIWGAQLELSPIATSYIPTTTGAVTRVKDDIYLTSASSLIGQTEGTLFIEVDWQNDTVSQGLLDINDGTLDNRLMIFNSAGSSANMYIRSGGGGALNQGVSSTSFTGIKKLAFTYEKSATATLKLFIDGTLESTATNEDTSAVTGLNEVIIGGQATGSGVSEANMWIRTVALFTSRLTDTECQDLTTL